jgi:hypothetical protein
LLRSLNCGVFLSTPYNYYYYFSGPKGLLRSAQMLKYIHSNVYHRTCWTATDAKEKEKLCGGAHAHVCVWECGGGGVGSCFGYNLGLVQKTIATQHGVWELKKDCVIGFVKDIHRMGDGHSGVQHGVPRAGGVCGCTLLKVLFRLFIGGGMAWPRRCPTWCLGSWRRSAWLFSMKLTTSTMSALRCGPLTKETQHIMRPMHKPALREHSTSCVPCISPH